MAETIGILIVGSIAPGAITSIGLGSSLAGFSFLGIGLTTIVGTAAILGASIGLQYALKPDVPKPQDGSQAIKQAIPSRIMGYGRNRLAGTFMLYEEAGRDSFDVQAFHSGKIGGIVKYYLNDDEVTLSGAFVQGGADGRYGGNNIIIEGRDGSASQTASSFADVSPLNTTWAADQVGNGIAWVSMRCNSVKSEDFSKVYPRSLPQLSVAADCALVWDPRDNTQIKTNPLSWKVSYNPVIQLIDYLTRVDGGLGLPLDMILPTDTIALWMAEADLCDALVDKADGTTEPRYQSSGWFQFDNKPEDVINNILATCDGWMAESGDGTFALTVGVYRPPTVTLTDKHIFGFSLNYGQADEQTVNQLDVSYTDPSQKYVSVQAESLRDEDAISLNGIVRQQQLDLKWTQSSTQADRLAYRAMQRLNPLLSGSFSTSLYGLVAVGKRWIKLQYPFVSGLQDSIIEIQGAEIDLMAGRCTFNFTVIAPTIIEAYDPDVDESDPIAVPPPVALVPLYVPQNIGSALVGDSTAGYRLVISFDDPNRIDLTYVARYRLNDGGTGVPGPWVEQSDIGSNTNGSRISITTGLVQAGATYSMQVASVGTRGSRSDWSAIASTVALYRESSVPMLREDGSQMTRETT